MSLCLEHTNHTGENGLLNSQLVVCVRYLELEQMKCGSRLVHLKTALY